MAVTVDPKVAPYYDVTLALGAPVFCDDCKRGIEYTSAHPRFSDGNDYDAAVAMHAAGWVVVPGGVGAFCPACAAKRGPRWRWPSKRFWRIKTTFFVVLLPALCANAVVSWWTNGMLALGPQRPDPGHLRVMGWLAATPMRPSETFPTGGMLFNVLAALGVNAVVWAWLGSLALAAVVEAVFRVVRRGRPAAA